MVKGKEIPFILSNKSMREAVKKMSKKKLGMVCVKEKNGKVSIITDGDCRKNSNNLYHKRILQVATKNPIWISDDPVSFLFVASDSITFFLLFFIFISMRFLY